MKAIVCSQYGPPDVLQIREVPKPVPKDNEILIKVHATTVTAADWRIRSLEMPRGFKTLSRLALGFSGPRNSILGTEVAGTVEAVGKDVKRFTVGDEVFALDGSKWGGYAEYKCMPADGAVARKPARVSFEEAAALSFGGTTALHFFRLAKLQKGEKVLINGASGGVGTAAVQLAKHYGAHITAVCSTPNMEWVRALGAHRVIDYTKEDFAQTGDTYDVIFDAVGTAPFSRSNVALKPDGRLLMIVGDMVDLARLPLIAMTSSKNVFTGAAPEQAEDLRALAQLAEEGVFKPVIDRRYPFEQIVDAHRYVDTRRKKGNVIISVA